MYIDCVWKIGEHPGEGNTIKGQQRLKMGKKKKNEVRGELSRAGSSGFCWNKTQWTWLCLTNNSSTHPKSNYKMLKDHSMKLVSLTLFHPLFSCSLWLKLSISFPLYVAFFNVLLRKIKSACFCIHPSCPLHDFGASFYVLSNECSKKGWMGLQWWKKRRWRRGSKKLCRIWRVHNSDGTITDSPFLVLALILPLTFQTWRAGGIKGNRIISKEF